MKVKKYVIGALLIGGVGIAAGVYLVYQQEQKSSVRKTTYTKELLRDVQEDLEEYYNKIHGTALDFKSDEYRPINIYPLNLSDAVNGSITDGWWKRLIYKRTEYKKVSVTSKFPKVYSTERVSHYELSSSGPDGIPDTSDDIDAWYISGHEPGSTERLIDKFERELVEAKKSPLEETVDGIDKRGRNARRWLEGLMSPRM